MRARLLKPGFFTNEALARLSLRARLLFAGLWGLADREGRLEDRPERIGAAVFPYERVRVKSLLTTLERAGFVRRYVAGRIKCLALPTFATHQKPHPRETASFLPAPPMRARLGHALGAPKEAPRRPGSSVYGSGKDQDQDQPAASRPVRFRVYTAIAAEVLRHAATEDLGELAEAFKVACAGQGLQPGAALTQKAIDAARAGRARRRA